MVKDKGFDAVSAYAMSGNQTKFSDLAKAVEKEYWEVAAKSGVPYIPLVTTGWDKHPRKDNPVTWETGHSYHKQDTFPSRAKPEEIAMHLENALTFLRKHKNVCEIQTIIIYAWNEYDEGGWLAPTRSEDGSPDTSRLDAVRDLLSK